ncbi:MAG: phosphoglucosamine mutase [Halobacteriovoraceae bacterium]|nr:phosphoglucosamine mutase [Halobacteriovoraceae bacterium]
MSRTLFGTDGMRGKANVYPMTAHMAMNLGRAVTQYFKDHIKGKEHPLIILGKDTRLSCYMLEQAFSAGVLSQGGKVVLTGPLPTPAVAFITKSMRANAGVMISASHNPYYDNGIKIFDKNGLKLSDDIEETLEQMILNPECIGIVEGEKLGNAKRLDEVIGRYNVHVKSTFDSSYELSGMKLVIDCAHGASYKVAPMVFSELGARIFSLGVRPNGKNINDKCGALYPQNAALKVIETNSDLGFCFDGDADRLIVCDNKGQVVEGDHLIGLFAKLLLDKGILKQGDEVVGTIMTNLGLEKYLNALGLNLYRAKVGDRYIIERMQECGNVLGGEPSGHIIFSNYSTTGDGLLAALKVIEAIKFYGKSLSDLCGEFKLYPQILKNVNVKEKIPLSDLPTVRKMIVDVENQLGQKSRVLLRYSGTENKLRIMAEGDDEVKVQEAVDKLYELVKSELS